MRQLKNAMHDALGFQKMKNQGTWNSDMIWTLSPSHYASAHEGDSCVRWPSRCLADLPFAVDLSAGLSYLGADTSCL